VEAAGDQVDDDKEREEEPHEPEHVGIKRHGGVHPDELEEAEEARQAREAQQARDAGGGALAAASRGG
jgi:hypothetical protein